MRAIAISHPGEPEVLEARELPDPVPGPDEVLVSVRATAVNRADLIQRRGLYPAPEGSPTDIPGLEFAGVVEARGDRVRHAEVGDRVMGIVGGGGYAEKIVVHERLTLAVPPDLAWESAAAVPEAFLTAYDALYRQGRMGPEESVLILAAGSGVGSAAAQLVTAGGGRAIASARTAAKRERLAALKLHAVLDPSRATFASEIRSAAGPRGVDLVLDLVGASAWKLYLDAMGEQARLLLVGLLGGSRTEVDLSVLLRKRVTIIGTVLRPRPIEERIALVQEFSRRIMPWIASGKVRPLVDRILPLEQAADAHRLLEQDATFGKVVLRVGRG